MMVTPNTQAIQRRYQNVVKDSTRQLQYNMILGRKLCVPPPSMDSPPPRFLEILFPVLTPLSLASSSQCGVFPFTRAEPVAIRVREQLPGVLAQDRALSVLRPRTREVAPGTLLCHCISQPASQPTSKLAEPTLFPLIQHRRTSSRTSPSRGSRPAVVTFSRYYSHPSPFSFIPSSNPGVWRCSKNSCT